MTPNFKIPENLSLPYSAMDKITQNIVNDREKRIEFILRNYVTPVIKGKITKGKLRWRGISIVESEKSFTCENGTLSIRWYEFVKQRDNIIFKDGTKLKYIDFINT